MRCAWVEVEKIRPRYRFQNMYGMVNRVRLHTDLPIKTTHVQILAKFGERLQSHARDLNLKVASEILSQYVIYLS